MITSITHAGWQVRLILPLVPMWHARTQDWQQGNLKQHVSPMPLVHVLASMSVFLFSLLPCPLCNMDTLMADIQELQSSRASPKSQSTHWWPSQATKSLLFHLSLHNMCKLMTKIVALYSGHASRQSKGKMHFWGVCKANERTAHCHYAGFLLMQQRPSRSYIVCILYVKCATMSIPAHSVWEKKVFFNIQKWVWWKATPSHQEWIWDF